MNQIYKLVYSKALNQLVVVSEHAKRATASTGSSLEKLDEVHGIESSMKNLVFTLNKLVIGATLLMGLPAITTAASANTNTNPQSSNPSATTATKLIEVDNTTTTQLNVTDHNGVAVININDANQSGISDNRFKKFSTDKGAVFNNSMMEVNSQVLGEKLAANPNLKHEAEVILAQVTGNDKSVIKGALEVIGKKADVVIVNPNGIDLNGGKLINVKDFTASTADVNQDIAHDLNLKVNKGEINVNGDLTSDDVNTIRLIANAIKVKAAIAPSAEFKASGKTKAGIELVAGSSKFNLKDKSIQAIDKGVAKDTRVAISGAALGSMYGSKVSFEVTDSGAGVAFDGVVMGDDNISINSKGEITLNKVITAKDLNIHTDSAANLGTSTQDNRNIFSADNLNVHASSVHTGNVVLQAKTSIGLDTNVQGGTGIALDGSTVVKAGQVTFNTQNLDTNSNLKLSANVFDVNANQHVDLKGKVVVDKATVSANSATTEGLSFAANKATFATAGSLNLTDSDIKAGALTFETGSTEMNNSMVAADLLQTTYRNVDSLVKDDKSDISANKLHVNAVNADNNLADFSTAKQFKDIDTFVAKFNAAQKEAAVGSVNIDKNTEASISHLNTLNVKGDFNNEGIFNTVNEAHDANSVINAGGKFNNKGMLVGDNLTVKANKGIDLSGITYTYQDLNLVAPEVNQGSGIVNVAKNLTAFTDSYKVQAQTEGSPTVNVDQFESVATHNRNATFTRYHTELVTHNVHVATNDMKLKGGTLTTGGDISISQLQGTEFAKGTDSEHKTAEQAKQDIRLDNTDGMIRAGGNIAVDGNVNNVATSNRMTVLDILSQPNEVYIHTNPQSLFGSDMGGWSTVKASSIKNLLDQIFFVSDDGTVVENYDSGKFAPLNYHLSQDDLYNTLKGLAAGTGQKDAYNQTINTNYDAELNKYISAVLGADWKGKTWDQAREAYIQELRSSDNDRAAVLTFNPGAKINAGGVFKQTNGDLYLGSNDENVIKDSVRTRTAADGSAFKTGYAENRIANVVKKQNIDTSIANLNDIRDMVEESVNKNADTYYQKTGESAFYTAEDVTIYHVTGKLAKHYTATREDVKQVLKNRIQLQQELNVSDSDIDRIIDAGNEGYTNVKVSKSLEQNADGTYNYQIKASNFRGESVVVTQGTYEGDGYVDYAKNEKIKEFAQDRSIDTAAQFDDKYDNDNNHNAAASINTDQAISVENAKNISMMYSTLDSQVTKLQADNIKIKGTGENDNIRSKQTEIIAKNLDVQGVLKTGDTTIKADDANFQAAQSYNSKGDLVNQGGLSASSLNMDIDNDLKARGFQFAATKDVNINVGGDLELTSTFDVASRFKSEQLTKALGQTETSEASKNVAGSGIKSTGGDIKIDVGGDATLESSSIQTPEHKADINVGGDLTSSAQQSEYQSTVHENKWDITAHAKAEHASKSAEIVAHLSSTEDNVPVDKNVTAYTGKATKTGGDAVNAGFGISFKDTTDTAHSLTSKNTKLDAQDLNIKVGGDADISNTDINKEAERAAKSDNIIHPDQPEKHASASIEAQSITQNNQKVDSRETSHSESGFQLKTEVYAGGSLVDAASHLGSDIAAGKNGEKLDGAMTALQTAGDVSGLLARQLGNVGARSGLSIGTANGKTETTTDSGNTMAGDVHLKATNGDVALKNVDGKNVHDLSIEATGDVSIAGGESTVKTEHQEHAFGIGVDTGFGVGITGAGATASANLNYQGSKTTSTDVVYDKTKFDNADKVSIKAGHDVNLTDTNIHGNDVAVDAGHDLNMKSHQDTHTSTTETYGAGISAGLKVSGIVSPSATSVNANYGKTTDTSAITNDPTSIAATDKLHVKAQTIDMTGAAIVGENPDTKMDVEADHIKAHDNEDFHKTEGAGFSIGLGHSPDAIARLDLGVTTPNKTDFKQITHATIAGDQLDKDKVLSKVEEGSLNTDKDKVQEVTKNDKYMGTNAGITLDPNIVGSAQKVLEKAYDLAASSSSASNSDSMTAGATSDSNDPYNVKSQIDAARASNDDYSSGGQFRSANAEQANQTRTEVGGVSKRNINGTGDGFNGEVDLSLQKHDLATASTTTQDQVNPDLGLQDTKEYSIKNLQTGANVNPQTSSPSATDAHQGTQVAAGGEQAASQASDAGVEHHDSAVAAQTGERQDLSSEEQKAAQVVKNPVADLDNLPSNPEDVLDLANNSHAANQDNQDFDNLPNLDSTPTHTGDSTGIQGGASAGFGGNDAGHTDASANNGHNTDMSGSNQANVDGSHAGDSHNTTSYDDHNLSGVDGNGSNSTTLNQDSIKQAQHDASQAGNDKGGRLDGGFATSQNPGAASDAYGRVDGGKTADTGLIDGNGGKVKGNVTSDGQSAVDTTNIDGDTISTGTSSTSKASSTIVSNGKATTTSGTGTGSTDSSAFIPANGEGASNGEALAFSDNATAVVYSSGDLTCYVITPKSKAAAKMQGSSSRSTIFSAYSKGIEQLVGDSGVLCVSNVEHKVETKFNVIQANANDIPIIKSAAPVRATMITNTVKTTRVERVVVRANVTTQRTKVLRQRVADISVSEIQKVRSALRAKGIDASKVLFLGAKTSSAQGITTLVNSMSTRTKADAALSK